MAVKRSGGHHGSAHGSAPHSDGDSHHKRHARSDAASKKQFSRSASHVHKKNLLSGGSVVNRGGIRL